MGYQYNPSQVGHILLVTYLATGTPESISQAYFNRLGVCLFVCLLSALAIPTPASQRSFTCMCFPRVPQKVGVNVSPSIARYLWHPFLPYSTLRKTTWLGQDNSPLLLGVRGSYPEPSQRNTDRLTGLIGLRHYTDHKTFIGSPPITRNVAHVRHAGRYRARQLRIVNSISSKIKFLREGCASK